MIDLIFKIDLYVFLIILTFIINVNLIKKLDFKKRTVRFLTMSITLLITIALTIMVLHVCSAESIPKMDFYIRSVIYLAEHLAIIFLFAMGYANFANEEKIVKYKRVLLAIPGIILGILLFINIYVPNFLFSISEDHNYIKGNYFVLIILIKVLYIPLTYIVFNKQFSTLSRINKIALNTTIMSNIAILFFQLIMPKYLFEIPIFFCNFIMINAFYIDRYINRDETTGLLKYKNALGGLKTDKEYTFILLEFVSHVEDTKFLVTEKLKRFANILNKAVGSSGVVTKYEANKYIIILEDEKDISTEDILTVIETNVRNENMHYEGNENIEYIYEMQNTKENKQYTFIDLTLKLVYRLIIKKSETQEESEV